jgi:ABC-type methionine transport system ATPase subunit
MATKRIPSNKLARSPQPEKRRFWLTYPSRLIKRPMIWEMSQKFAIIFNIRQASVGDEVGIMCLELEGKREDMKSAIRWLEKLGVQVEPIEIGVIEA